MHDPLDFEKRPLISLLHRKRRLAALSLFTEICGRSLWRIASWLALFTGLWLLQIPDIIGSYGPHIFLVAFLSGFAYLLYKDLRHLHWPNTREIDRRLEIASGLPHRPIGTIEDKLVNPRKEETRTLWESNRLKAFAVIYKLRIPLPHAILSGEDHYALRNLAALVLIIGIIVAGSQWGQRLQYGLFPFMAPNGTEKGSSPITLWITPPEYTALPQLTLQGSGKSKETIDIPQGSILKIRMSKSLVQPKLTMADQTLPLEQLGERSWGIETEIKPGERLKLMQWVITRANISYKFIKDEPPVLTLNGETETLSKGETRIPIKVLDDYGVTDLTMRMDLDPMITDKPMGTSYEETRAVMSPPATELELTPIYDLSWHPWAGLPVTITFEGIDHLKQKGAPPAISLTLPERSFNHPVASALIEMRKRLIWTPKEAASNISYELEELLQDPSQFQFDPIVMLAIRSAASRLAYDREPEGIARVIELLWDTALRIEEGDLPLAARNLRDAQRNLEQVLSDPNATDEEVAKALEKMQMGMAEYFQELYREMQKRMAESGQQMQLSPEMFKNLVNPEDIASFLDQLKADALSGDRDSARELLSQLQQFMDMLNPSTEMAMPPQMEFMMEGINELQELIEKQQALLDQTQRQADRASGKNQQSYPEFVPFDQSELDEMGMGDMPPPPGSDIPKEMPEIDTSQNKTEQDALRYILGQLMLETDEQLGEIPENMGKAEQEMRKSGDNLGKNQPLQSIPHQEQAIAYLQDAMKDMSQQMQQMMQQMMMLSLGMGQLDPLGRPMSQEGDQPGMFPGSRVKIPDEAERKRVQEILKTLRKRSGEVERPDYELEYYRRLMKQF